MKHEEMLMRSCSPSEAWWDPAVDRPSSQLFKPTPKDEGKLSVADGNKTTPDDFFKEFTVAMGLQSRGIWGITKEEIAPVEGVIRKKEDGSEEEVFLEYEEDEGQGKPLGHCLLDMSGLSKSLIKRVAKTLRNKAVEHGCLYAP